MGDLRLLPGEREELHFRPSPLGFLGRYARALLPAAWGLTLAALFATNWWHSAPAEPGWRFWGYFYGNVGAAYLYAVGGLLAGGGIMVLLRHTYRPVIVAGILAACVALGSYVLPFEATRTLPPLMVLASLPLLVRWELCRSGTHVHITNLRIVRRDTFPRAGSQQALWSELVDVDARQGPFGRLTDTGTLLAVSRTPKGGQPEELRLIGVRPLRRIQHLLELMAQDATAGEAVRQHEDLTGRVGEALAALHRK